MTNLLLGSALAVIYLIMFWFLGAVIPERFQTRSIPVMCMTGFLVYYALFQSVALPMKISKQPLSRLTIIWGCILLALAAYVILKRRKVLQESMRGLRGSGERMVLLVFMAVLALGVAFLLGFNTNTISDYDAGYYIGLPVSSAYSNTLELLSPFEGQALGSPKSFYLMNTDTLHSAVIYQALNIHPLIERKWSFTIAMAVLFEMVLYKCAEEFFQKEYAKTGLFCLFANLVQFFSYSISGVSHYFAYRAYEGKSIISYLYMTLIFCFGLSLYKKKERKWPWAGMFLCAASGAAFSNTAIFVVPCMTGLILFPYILTDGILHKQWNIIRNYVCVLLPGLFWLVLYKVL